MDYMTDYSRWCDRVCEDYLKDELAEIKGDDNAIKERFAAALTFGTAGLRGVLGAGPNRMNVYTVGQATQGLAEWVLANGGGSVAISYDSRRRSAEFARETASVLAANGVKAYIYDRLMPTPMLSFAVRELHCAAGVMVTASHNPAQYNGYKAYGPDGCQMTEHDADAVYANIQSSDIFDGVKRTDFDVALAEGTISYIGQDVIEKYYDCVKSQSVRCGICAQSPIKIVYSPLNGTGNEPVRRVLDDIGVKNIAVVKEQELPDGDFPTCPYPNPEMREALALGLELAKKEQADVFIATDPDADRIGVAFRRRDGEYQIMSGNEIGALLLKYICAARAENGTMPKDPVAVMSIVSTDLAGDVAAEYGVELRKVLTGFKYIGETILHLEQKGEQSRFIFGFEESCGYLTGGYVRDKDAVVASLMVCEMTAWLKRRGMTAPELLEELFAAHGYYKNKVVSHEFAGLDGKAKMASVMNGLHECPPAEISGLEIVAISDYKTHKAVDLKNGGESVIDLPATDAIAYTLAGGATVVVRPSGTEPKMKVYLTAKEPTAEGSQSMIAQLEGGVKQLLGL